MTRFRAVGIAMIAFSVGLGSAWAQFTVTDPGTTERNVLTAALKGQIFDTLTQEYQRLQRMAERLTTRTTLSGYVQSPPQPANGFGGEDVFYANDYWYALTHGDALGTAYLAFARERQDPEALNGGTTVNTQNALTSGLAMLDLADGTIIAATNDVGVLRQGANRDRVAIDQFERDVVNPSSQHSATAILDKVSGGLLIGTRQRQERLEYLTAVAEQLLVDNKRARDTEAAVMNMQLGRLRAHREHADDLVGGSESDLRTWRQP